MKKTVNLNKTVTTGPNYLGQSDFQSRDTIYLINSDFTLREQIYLPYDSEIRIEAGSITFSEGSRIFLPYNNQPNGTSNLKLYSMLSVGPSLSDGATITVGPSRLLPGSVLRSFDRNSFYLELYGKSRMCLPEYGPEALPNAYSDEIRGKITVKSAEGSEIEIDGKTTLNFYAEDCNFRRVFISPNGFGFINRSKVYDLEVVLKNCKLWADDYGDNLGIGAPKIPLDVLSQKDCPSARLEALDCVFDNAGIQGEVYVENCRFLFGGNLLNNNEQIHCGSHSRILNSYFDGRNGALNEYDIIDTYNGGDIVIENCTFVNYKSSSIEPNLITVKSHYRTAGSGINDQLEDSHFKGQQTGVTVRNCYFDLPDFHGYIIQVWNGPRDGSENRALNRQFTNIESNFIKASGAIFVGCTEYTDCTRICNNSGQVKNLVFVNNKYRVHNLEIRNNWLVANGTQDVNMSILSGSNIDNVILSGNITCGYIWTDFNPLLLSGNIRITDNETVGTSGLFNLAPIKPGGTSVSDGNDLAMNPGKDGGTVNFFFSGNVSKGKKTDEGNMETANAFSDGILFVGRQFFCTEGQFSNQLMAYNGTSWVKA